MTETVVVGGLPEWVVPQLLPKPADGCWHGPARRTGERFLVGDEPGQQLEGTVDEYRSEEFDCGEFSVLVESVVDPVPVAPRRGLLWSSAFDRQGNTLVSLHFECLGRPGHCSTWSDMFRIYDRMCGTRARLIEANGHHYGWDKKARGVCALARIDHPSQGTALGDQAVKIALEKGLAAAATRPCATGAVLFVADAAGLFVSIAPPGYHVFSGKVQSHFMAEVWRNTFQMIYEPLVLAACPEALCMAIEHRFPGLTQIPRPLSGLPVD